MKTTAKSILATIALLGLAACEEQTRWNDANQEGVLKVVPEEVLELAAPGQNTDVVKLDPETNCFWYLHRGPVEDTFLPLRTSKGGPICAPKSEEAAS